MANFTVWMTCTDGQPRIKVAECDTRGYAEFIMAALKAYKPNPVQEADQGALFTDTFKLDPVKVIRETESRETDV